MFETFDHTADVGLRVSAGSLEELFVEAARGLTSLLMDNVDELRAEISENVEIADSDVEYLLFDWLNELLFRFETRGLLFREFRVEIEHDQLRAALRGEACDRTRHRLAHEVKAITYHGLKVEQADSVWRAEFIVDI